MKSILYILAVLLLTTWLVGTLVYMVGAWVHLFLISSLLVILLLSRMDRTMTT
ncbi:MAG TPA: DUF5670 family protein [Chryseolinea sp.]|nr:DUF5670 family protein [Chryseolinea sp.]